MDSGRHIPPARWLRPILSILAATALAGTLLTGAGSSRQEAESALSLLRERLHPAHTIDDLGPLLQEAARARIVLLGESTHGTREFYLWRAKISRQLVENHGFTLLGIEGDWAATARLNRFLLGEGSSSEIAGLLRSSYTRWPQWMWANEEFKELLIWLRDWNGNQPREKAVRLFGLDVYGHDQSLTEVKNFFEHYAPSQSERVRGYYATMARFGADGQAFAWHAWRTNRSYADSMTRVVDLIRGLQGEEISRDAWLDAKQNALVVKRAEAHYRIMMEDDRMSWNIRAGHMWQTAQRLLEQAGPQARMILWAHNTHIGDARAGGLGPAGMVNLGYLSRRDLGKKIVFLLGFATHRGSVIAGTRWGVPWEIHPVPEARPDSWDYLLYRASPTPSWMLFTEKDYSCPVLGEQRPQRGIGVVYQPANERRANYSPAALAQRFDALLFFPSTEALRPLP